MCTYINMMMLSRGECDMHDNKRLETVRARLILNISELDGSLPSYSASIRDAVI